MKNVQIVTSTGSVISYGYSDMTANAGYNPAIHQVVQVGDESFPPEGVQLKYVKVVDGEFIEMTQAEKDAVDAATPVSIVQRYIVNAEQIITTRGTDANTGWTSLIGGMKTSKWPLVGGDWQLIVSLDLALVANATWGTPNGPDRAAEARVMWNGVQVATWVNPYARYDTKSVPLGDTLAHGVKPTIDVQARLFGTATANVRCQKVRVELSPTTSAVSL